MYSLCGHTAVYIAVYTVGMAIYTVMQHIDAILKNMHLSTSRMTVQIHPNSMKEVLLFLPPTLPLSLTMIPTENNALGESIIWGIRMLKVMT